LPCFISVRVHFECSRNISRAKAIKYNTKNIPKEDKKKDLSKEIAELQEKKSEVLLASGKELAYVKDRVFKYRQDWWDEWYKMLKSDERDLRKTAIVEYNKLQQKVLPTQLDAGNGGSVTVNILGMGIDQSEPPRNIEGEIINE